MLGGIALSLLPFLSLLDSLLFFVKALFFFSISVYLQYIIQINLLKENRWVNPENKFFLNLLKQELIFLCLIGLLQMLILIVFFYISLPISYSINKFKLHIVIFSLLQPFTLNFFYIMLYLIQQNAFLRKEVESFHHLSKITQNKTLQDLVSPHFLFNSLNTAASITSENPAEAVNFVEKLSDLYEFIIKNNENQLIELREELEIIEKYGFLIQTRFGDFFSLEIKIPKEYFKTLIPPLTLQNLVENAVKHNSLTRKKPLTLKIDVLENYIIVENNINPKKTFRSESTKLGIQYIKNQFQQFSSNSVKISQDKDRFRVEIPLIHESKS